MSKSITLTFSEDEAEILVDALDSDLEGYEDSAKDARANGNRADVITFAEAATRIKAVRDRVRKALDA
ncbi:MAG: hypothetical protein DI547_02950 [Sphingobium sp.]|jgi:hypothetical protein|nr:MAG: hypothetical protein DI547_02950 [Sphingobium sp.]